jgi:hypothetical protein
MFTKEEVKRNALGCFETALFMPSGAKRFGNTYDEAVRSFLIPAFLFPLTILAVYFYPTPDLAGIPKNTLAFLFSMRMFLSWIMFFGLIHWILRRVDHMDYFYRFVIATNWLALPATIVFMPVVALLFSGAYSWEEIHAFTMFIVFYSYAFTAYMAVYALIIPWEMAAFITVIAMMIDDKTLELIHWVGNILGT